METEQGLDNVWGHTGIARVIGRTPRQAHYLLSQGVLPAKKVGGRWVASREALKAFFATSTSSSAAA